MDDTHPLNTEWALWEHRSKDVDDDCWMDQFHPAATVERRKAVALENNSSLA